MSPAPSTWSLKDISRLARDTSSQSPLGHDSGHRHPPSSDLRVPINQKEFTALGVALRQTFGRHKFTGSWNTKNQPWTEWTVPMWWQKLPRCRKVAVNFDFTISANYGYVCVCDFDNVVSDPTFRRRLQVTCTGSCPLSYRSHRKILKGF